MCRTHAGHLLQFQKTMSEEKTLFGFPIIETDTAPVGEIIFGRFPTESELYEMSRLSRKPYTICDWIRDHPTEFCVVKNISE